MALLKELQELLKLSEEIQKDSIFKQITEIPKDVLLERVRTQTEVILQRGRQIALLSGRLPELYEEISDESIRDVIKTRLIKYSKWAMDLMKFIKQDSELSEIHIHALSELWTLFIQEELKQIIDIISSNRK